MTSSENGPVGAERFLLSGAPAGRQQRRLALLVLACLLAGLAAAAPFARLPLQGSGPLLPAYAAAMLVNETITAVLLLALFAIERSRAILLLAAGYLFSGLLVVPWLLTFPGVVGEQALVDAGLQSTATVAALRRIGFPLFLLGYVLACRAAGGPRIAGGRAAPAILATVAGCLAAALTISLLVIRGQDLLPGWMADGRSTTALWSLVPVAAGLLCLAALLLLWNRRKRSVLDLWLMVVLCTLIIEILLLGWLAGGGRFSLGWWAGRLYGLAASSTVLFVLLAQTTSLYARLARSAAAERRAREARLASMEALSASIAHEVNQPLASMVTNADAALRWLNREPPELGEVRAALGRIVADGHRGGHVIRSIRAIFRREPAARRSLDLNALIEEVVRRRRREAELGRIVLRLRLAERLPRVSGDPIQLEQLVSNLLANAVEAVRAEEERGQEILLASDLTPSGGIVLSVADNGPGISPRDRERLFEPFFTTKPEGMGMGLMFCRTIVEAHGGRIWMTDNAPRGAVFHVVLPPEPGALGATGTTPMGRAG